MSSSPENPTLEKLREQQASALATLRALNKEIADISRPGATAALPRAPFGDISTRVAVWDDGESTRRDPESQTAAFTSSVLANGIYQVDVWMRDPNLGHSPLKAAVQPRSWDPGVADITVGDWHFDEVPAAAWRDVAAVWLSVARIGDIPLAVDHPGPCQLCGSYGDEPPGWYCPFSPTLECDYEHPGHYDPDDCRYCHHPEERK